MDVPSPSAGVVKMLSVKVCDKVKEASLILTRDSTEGAKPQPAAAAPAPAPSKAATAPAAPSPPDADRAPRGEAGLADAPGEGPTATPPEGASVEVRVPDIGDFRDVPVIELFVKPGDIVKIDDPLVTLESDKATMDVPSPVAGAIQGVRVSVGDRVSEGTVIATIAAAGAAPSPQPAPSSAKGSAPPPSAAAPTPAPPRAPAVDAPAAKADASVDAQAFKAAHASPSVRKFARELGVDLSRLKGSGPSGRITQEDVQR